ncbi:MAG TPA: hypothetical protein VLQ91_11225 [Draconibacterium sp.]|nr:hypothetical protein [Draconibacterium sp.]
MKRFIINTLCFISIVLISIYFILLKVDGYTDPYYLKFTTRKQNSLIIGTSKSAQGIVPDIVNEILDIEIYNYSFNMNISPFGPKYLESLKRKLTQKNKNGVFIVTVDCWSISSTCINPNDTLNFRENNSCIGEIKIVDKNPNMQYLYKYMFGNYYKAIFKSSVALLHDNGWYEVSLNMDSISVNRRTYSTLLEYENNISIYKYSQTRVDYLIKTIEFLDTYGDVYLVRLPISPKLMEIENQLNPNFNSIIQQISRKKYDYLDLTPKNDLFNYTDGVHLSKNSSKIVTKEISNWIKNIETTRTRN